MQKYNNYANVLKHKLKMEVMVTIRPVNEEIAKKLNALRILNDFIALGFNERKSFAQVVMDECPEFKDMNGLVKLNNFWALRDFSINEKLEKVLDNLKQS